MIGLAFLAIFGVYLLLSVALTKWAAGVAKRRGIAGWKFGLPMALLMYSLVFWDWLPMEGMFKYYCATEAGFTVYKTLDQWKQENPGVAETLVPIENPPLIRKDGVDWYFLNQRFAWAVKWEDKGLHIQRREERIVDRETGEVLAQYVDFRTDIPPFGLGTRRSGAYKLWMMKGSCERGVGQITKPVRFEFSKYMYLVQYQREYEK